MKKVYILWCALVSLATMGYAQKQVFLPDSLCCYDLNDSNIRWCWQRSVQTDNIIVFWEKVFGDDLSNPPMLDGKSMSFDLDNLLQRV